MLKIQIEITKKAEEVAQARYMVAQNRYLVGKFDITNLNIALNEKDAAKPQLYRRVEEFLARLLRTSQNLYDFMAQQPLYTQAQ
jgi:outer membrane protein TolC